MPSIRAILDPPGAPAATGDYSPATVTAGLCFVSCQLGTDPPTGELVDGFGAQAERALDNVEAVLVAADTSWASVASVTVLLADRDDAVEFGPHYRRRFSDGGPFPARVIYQAGGLAPGALVGVSAIAAVDR